MVKTSKRTIFFPAVLMLLVLFGCDRKEEAVSENPVSSERPLPDSEAVAPATSIPAVTTAEEQGSDSTVVDNRPPMVIVVPLTETRIHRGVDIEIRPEGFDPDGDLLTFRFAWFINDEKVADFDESVLPGDRFHKGDRIALRIVPFDGKTEGSAFTAQPFVVPNAPPFFVSTPPLQFQTQNYVYESRAEDPDEEPLTYHLEAGPAGMTVAADTGRVAWPISQEQTGDHTVRLVAQDVGGLQAVQEFILTIKIGEEGN